MESEQIVPDGNTIATVCRNIRVRRAYLDITQADLAARLGVSPRTISFWETGSRKPDSAQIAQIAAALNVPVGFLYDEVAA